jgi:hypothetical protein
LALASTLAKAEIQRAEQFAAADALRANANGESGDGGNGGVSQIGRIETGWSPLDRAIERAAKNPDLLFYKLQTNAYKFSWALIPISVPFVWLLFLHRRRYRRYGPYDHTIFVTYSIAFMSLGFVALSLLRPIGLGDTLPGLAMALVPPLHMYRQLRGAYQLSRPSALWRTALLLIFAMIAGGLFFALLLALGALG